MSWRSTTDKARRRLASEIELRYRRMRRQRLVRGAQSPLALRPLDPAHIHELPYCVLPRAPGPAATAAARALLDTMTEVAALLARHVAATEPRLPSA